jgi:hypothetical protein
MEIEFEKEIENISLQIGDVAYVVTPTTNGYTDTPSKIGEITAINTFSITVSNTSSATVAADDFIMFSKNNVINNSSLLGYYAEVKLSNDSTEKAELFALGSEVVQSSK